MFARVPRPALQHYTCMVEILGCAGEVDEAEGLVVKMEAHPDRVIFAALLAMCMAASTSPSGCPSSCAGMVLSENARSD